MATRLQVVEEAQRWLGTRYVHKQSVRGSGTDCVGLLFGVYQTVGLIPAHLSFQDVTGDYPVDWCLHRGEELYLQGLAAWCIPGLGRLGDIAIFQWGRTQSHTGIVSGTHPVKFIHAYAPAKSVTESFLSGFWADKFRGFLTVRGLDG